MPALRPLLAFAPLLFAGCALSERLPIEDPDQVATADIRITLTVDGGSDRITAVASLTSPVGSLRLADHDDVLLGGLRLDPTTVDGRPAYLLSTPTRVGPTAFVVRRAVDASVEASIDLPAPPVLSGPPSPVSRAAPLTVTWPAAPDGSTWTTSLSVKGACIRPLERNLAFDGGTYTIAAGDLVDAASPGGSCPLTVTVTRLATGRQGSVSSTARQARSLTVESTP